MPGTTGRNSDRPTAQRWELPACYERWHGSTRPQSAAMADGSPRPELDQTGLTVAGHLVTTFLSRFASSLAGHTIQNHTPTLRSEGVELLPDRCSRHRR